MRKTWVRRAARAIMQFDCPLACPVVGCGLDFDELAQLKGHYCTSHLKARRFHCDMCPKRMPTQVLLDRHVQEHLHAKPFPCTMLGCQSRSFHSPRLTLRPLWPALRMC